MTPNNGISERVDYPPLLNRRTGMGMGMVSPAAPTPQASTQAKKQPCQFASSEEVGGHLTRKHTLEPVRNDPDLS